jgi:hypothetical protein
MELEGSIALRFESRRGPYDTVAWDSGTVEESFPGWQVTGIAVMVPSDVGWLIHDLVTREN